MNAARSRLALIPILALALGCGGGMSPGIRQGPSDQAVTSSYGATPDSVITRVWEVLRGDGVLSRSFERSPSDSSNVAHLESDWVFIPNVLASATFGHLSDNEKWVKLLFWAMPERGGTKLYMDVLYSPLDPPTEPVNWTRLRPIPGAHPAWAYVEVVMTGINRRLGVEQESG
ncbi:MAG: hypothetical protein ACE5HF_00375 [Gemmatimonadota bacterium]